MIWVGLSLILAALQIYSNTPTLNLAGAVFHFHECNTIIFTPLWWVSLHRNANIGSTISGKKLQRGSLHHLKLIDNNLS